jgi:hypothetical protein
MSRKEARKQKAKEAAALNTYANDIALVKSRIDRKPVKLCFTDGEEAIVKIISVSETEKDVIYDVVSLIVKNLFIKVEHF